MLELISRAEAFGSNTAIESHGKTYSYRKLLDASYRLTLSLLGAKQDLQEARVAFLVDPGFDYVRIQWAIWRAGGIAVPLCTLHPLPSLRYVIENTDAEFLIVSDAYESLLKELAEERQMTFINIDRASYSLHIQRSLPEIDKNRRAMILYTSGTTSLPKGVVSSHANIEAQIKTLVDAWQWQSSDHILCVLPLHHVHGIINVVSCALWSGAVVEFLPKFDANGVYEVFRKGKVNIFMAVPTIYYKLITAWESYTTAKQEEISQCLKAFRLMVSGSAALPISVLEQWRNISGHTLLERYGMTEIGMAVSNSYEGERRPGHIGLPLPGVELRLVNEQGNEVEQGESGEIQVKGPNIFREYWQNPKATQEAFTSEGWFKTGDIAQFNQGSYKILGRNSVDIIKSGGYKISALEIEEVLRTHPAINDCGVVGIPDPEWGELIAAALVMNENTWDAKEIRTWLQALLPAYKVPRKYIAIQDLPRNTLGKVTKNELKKLF